MMDPTVPQNAGKANTVGVRGTDVAFGTPAFVADFKKYVAGKNISYVAKVGGGGYICVRSTCLYAFLDTYV